MSDTDVPRGIPDNDMMMAEYVATKYLWDMATPAERARILVHQAVEDLITITDQIAWRHAEDIKADTSALESQKEEAQAALDAALDDYRDAIIAEGTP